VEVPGSIGPVVFGVGVGWVMIRCPRQYDELMRRAGGTWDPGAAMANRTSADWAGDPRTGACGRPVVRLAQAGIRLEWCLVKRTGQVCRETLPGPEAPAVRPTRSVPENIVVRGMHCVYRAIIAKRRVSRLLVGGSNNSVAATRSGSVACPK